MKYDVLEKYIVKFAKEIEIQPPLNDEFSPCQDVYNKWLKELKVREVVELGAGNGILLSLFPAEVKTVGVSLGGEPGMIPADMNTPPFYDESVDLVIARHAVEHSLMPLIMLCEMARITRKYALVIVPCCNEEMANYDNHYSVFTATGWKALFKRAGFAIAKEELLVPLYRNIKENRFLLVKI